MKNKIFNFGTILFVLFNVSISSQIPRTPYPIIFVHGLNDGDTTWATTLGFLGGQQKIFDVCLNHDGDNYTSLLEADVNSIGWRDNNSNAPSPTGLYAINFDNTRFSQSGHSSHTLSNQAAIYKQGRALQMMIREVLRIDSADKVILVGHSMGGLAIREYLQRTDSDGRNIWWADQSTYQLKGPQVAKVVTIGTPHGGSDAMARLAFGFGIDAGSEAVRDLRISSVYLEGGDESSIPITPFFGFWNRDVNCNGHDDQYNDQHVWGLNIFPFPQDIKYTWITSNWDGLGDFAVDIDRQWLHNVSNEPLPANITDTLLTHKYHTDEPADYHSIIRGLDEPDDTSLAYLIGNNNSVSGFITYQKTNYSKFDDDIYKINLTNDGYLIYNIKEGGSGAKYLTFFKNQDTILNISNVSIFDVENIHQYLMKAGTYYFKVSGEASDISFGKAYTLTTSYAELQLQIPNGGESYSPGSTVNIQWTSTNFDNVKIEYTTDGGIAWATVITSTPAFGGTYPWVIPNTPSANCKIRISDVENLANYDTSNGAFAITSPPLLTLTSPNGGESWSVNSTQQIQWSSSNIANVKIEYTTNNGTNWNTIIASYSASSGSYTWIVPNTISSNCKIKISDVLNSSVFDISDNTFTISQRNNSNPVVTNVAFSISGTIVTVTYNVTDAEQSTVTISTKVSSDNGVTWSYNFGTASGNIGNNVSVGIGKTITWAYSGVYNPNFKIMIAANDGQVGGSDCGTVDYGGKTYNTVQIGTQCWLKENLDVGTRTCYDNNEANCTTYGGLYQWNEAMAYSTTPGTKGICPAGWHIPTITEFQTLAAAVNNDGNALKAVGQGTGSGIGTNTSGFSALLAGYRFGYGGFYGLGGYADFWSSTVYDASSAYRVGLWYGSSDIYVYDNFKDFGFSIRCLKD